MSVSVEHFQKICSIILPAVILMFALMLNLTVMPITSSFKVIIPFVFIVSFYWSIYRPDIIPLWSIFMFGIVLDLLSGLPLGLNAFSLMAVCWVIRDQRAVLITQPFLMIWLLFIMFCAIEAVIKWFLFGLAGFNWGDLMAALPDVMFGVFVYPLISIFLHFVTKLCFGTDGY